MSVTGPEAYWSFPIAQALKEVAANPGGLSDSDAATRLKKYGANTFKATPRTSSIVLFLRQFKSPITILLIVAAFLSMGLNDVTNALIILFIILVSSLLGFWQERGATNAVNELLKMVQIRCSLVRNGKETELPVEQVVPGDIIILKAGDVIPGDCLLLESKDLYVNEASFTGETFPVEKTAGTVPADAPLSKRSNTLFMGAHVISGKARAVVIKTGRNTEFGAITARLRSGTPETDFEKGARHFGYMLMEITLILIIIIFSVNVLLHKPALESILFSLALAVGLTPQLLPAIISINLAAGARKMAKNKVIVKRLSSIENFGSMNILCSDKTGTITEGKVMLKDALDYEGKPSGKTLHFAWLNASLQRGYTNPVDQAIQAACSDSLDECTVQAEVPYDFFRKRLTIVVKHGADYTAITKGALTAVLAVCDRVETGTGQVIAIDEELEAIKNEYEKICNAGYRVLGVATRQVTGEMDFTRNDEKNMVFQGFITLFDPPKKDVLQTITELHNMGVQLKIITGDNELVARSLAQQIGMNDPVIITGGQIHEMSNDALLHQAVRAHIFAEVEPNQKEKIIQLLRKSGNVVGFMGDGINDAPALHAADVGISVDSAVDVAKEAADIVLLNQSLEVLITGIIAGRKTFTNTMKYIFMAASANFGNMFSMAGASLFLPFLPLLPKQILLTNLLTDFPEMAIASDRVDDIAVSKPHSWDLKFIRRFMIVFGLISSIFDYLTFYVLIHFMKAGETVFQTGWFVESVVSASMIVLVMRTRLPFFKSLPGKQLIIATSVVVALVLLIPYSPFAGLLAFSKLPVAYYGWMLLIVAAYIITAELAKKWFFRQAKNQK
ncbi:magnesium-translocating P-type ATPase [Niastella koreensis]|uniref:Magnesium-transporting ATPase, P-type 1 n=2 Tax=Niastella koreensis TaxID=354356 RepID=G8TBU0_NIAKG|nr:magnesium-translocating P-type ATPase [Niastella koreensis]AEV98222.1 magnesium-translocating P-type ATPase [Niastella koreensis GR20-10]OQP44331.1 magnesium-translocating P-type ATPase [Niastella koreensis]